VLLAPNDLTGFGEAKSRCSRMNDFLKMLLHAVFSYASSLVSGYFALF